MCMVYKWKLIRMYIMMTFKGFCGMNAIIRRGWSLNGDYRNYFVLFNRRHVIDSVDLKSDKNAYIFLQNVCLG